MSIPLKEEYPKQLSKFIEKYPDVWEAYTALGESCGQAGPLNKKVLSLLKMVTSVSLKMETPFKTHLRKAIKAGASREEIEHALLTLITSIGISGSMMAFKWAQDIFDEEGVWS